MFYAHAVVRSRFYDDYLLAATAAGCEQVVLLAAGLDTRAFRLPWAKEVRLVAQARAMPGARITALWKGDSANKPRSGSPNTAGKHRSTPMPRSPYSTDVHPTTHPTVASSPQCTPDHRVPPMAVSRKAILTRRV